jgi:hypothetical protein
MAGDRDQRRDLVYTVMNLRDPRKREVLRVATRLLASQEELCPMEIVNSQISNI